MSRIDIRSIRREQILKATEQLVAEHGWERATFAEICKAADVSNRVLTYHFEDKEDILLSLLERTAQQLRGAFFQRLPTDLPAQDLIALIAPAGMGFVESHAQLYRLALHFLNQATYRPDIAERLRPLFLDSRTRITNLIQHGVARGDLSVSDPEKAAAVIQASLFGMVLAYAALGISVPADEIATMLRSYLTATKPQSSPRR
jgi:TetR/AcrR family transcriptional regulator, transcriptional repressor of bet genes